MVTRTRLQANAPVHLCCWTILRGGVTVVMCNWVASSGKLLSKRPSRCWNQSGWHYLAAWVLSFVKANMGIFEEVLRTDGAAQEEFRRMKPVQLTPFGSYMPWKVPNRIIPYTPRLGCQTVKELTVFLERYLLVNHRHANLLRAGMKASLKGSTFLSLESGEVRVMPKELLSYHLHIVHFI